MAPCQIIFVLLLALFLQFCNCSRPIRAAAEDQKIKSEKNLLQYTYMPAGAPPANHNKMAGSETQYFTSLTEKMVEKKPTSEYPLSGKKKKKKKQQINMKLKGASSKIRNELSNRSSRKSMAVPWHKFDHEPTFHVDYSAPKTHPPKNN